MSPAPAVIGSGDDVRGTMENVFAALCPMFPATSVCSAWAVYVPSGSGAEASTDQAPLITHDALSVWSGVPVALLPR